MRTDTYSELGVRVTGLVKSYGSVRAVRGIDLAVRAGETVALLGPSGAGKSTTIDTMLGLARPDEGSVSVFGQSTAAAVRAGLVGTMLQTGGQPDYLRVREVIALTASYYPNPLPVDEVLELSGAAAFADHWATRLSAAQSRLVRFAAAIVGDPDLLVLDEPTAAVCAEHRQAFWRSVRRFAGESKTVLFATHHLQEAAEYADRIVLMVRGQVLADGPTAEIKAQACSRTIRATLPEVEPFMLAALPGVITAQRDGDTIVLLCTDADLTLRALLATFAAARDIEVHGGSLDDVFLELTGEVPGVNSMNGADPEVAK